MLRKLTGLMLFGLAVFLMVEFSYRFFVMGPQAFNLRKVNSMNTLMRSEFVQLSEFPDVFFELKADMDGWFKGKRFTTNSAGLVDKEYALEKPEGAHRVAVVGSSWTMATGVEQQDSWHAVIERQQVENASSPPVEMINFGVEMYGLREIVGTVRHKALAWQPDVVLVAITSFTLSFLWEETTPEASLPLRAYPALQSFALSDIVQKLGLADSRPADDRARLDSGVYEARLAQLQRALADLDQLSKASGVPIAVVFLGYSPMGTNYILPIEEQVRETDLTIVYANRLFMDMPSRQPYQVSRFDRHPNAAGHQLIADFLATELVGIGVLPANSMK